MTSREFEPPAPGSWDSTSRGFATANHESGHAAIAHWHGLELIEVRVDHPITTELGTLGLCAYVKVRDPTMDDYRAQLHVTLAGPLAEGRRLAWPAPRDSNDSDVANAGRLAFILGMGEDDWNRAHDMVAGLLSLPTVRRWIKDLSGALLDRGALPGEQATDIFKKGREPR